MSIRASTLGLALAALALTTANAADLGRRMPTKAPVAAPIPPFTWTGCYVGGFIGGAWQEDPTFTDFGNTIFGAYSGGVTTPVTLAAPHSWTTSADGTFIGGGLNGRCHCANCSLR